MKSHSLLIILVMSLQLLQCRSESFSRISFNSLEVFLNTDKAIYHMELDLLKDDGSIMFSTWEHLHNTDGTTASTLATIKDSFIAGFRQLNKTHVVLVAENHYCVKILNRVDNNTRTLAGTCGSKGYDEGGVGVGKLGTPFGIEIDVRNPNRLLIADGFNNAIRSVDICTGELSTVINSSLNRPTFLAWADDKLLVTNDHYLSQVSWHRNGSVTNTIVAGSTRRSSSVGSFSSSRFDYPSEVAKVGFNMYLVADYHNRKLKLLDFNSHQVNLVCGANPIFKRLQVCKISSDQPKSILKVGEDVYVGFVKSIYKLKGLRLPFDKFTVYLDPGQNTSEFRLPGSSYTGCYQEGSYMFFKDPNEYSEKSFYYINVTKSPILRRLTFASRYDVSCYLMRNAYNRVSLRGSLAQRRRQLQQACAHECNMSVEMQPWYECRNNEMTIYWPTDKTFSVVYKAPPEYLKEELRERLVHNETEISTVRIQTLRQPSVEAKPNCKGEKVLLLLVSECADDTLRYDSFDDTCI